MPKGRSLSPLELILREWHFARDQCGLLLHLRYWRRSARACCLLVMRLRNTLLLGQSSFPIEECDSRIVSGVTPQEDSVPPPRRRHPVISVWKSLSCAGSCPKAARSPNACIASRSHQFEVSEIERRFVIKSPTQSTRKVGYCVKMATAPHLDCRPVRANWGLAACTRQGRLAFSRRLFCGQYGRFRNVSLRSGVPSGGTCALGPSGSARLPRARCRGNS